MAYDEDNPFDDPNPLGSLASNHTLAQDDYNPFGEETEKAQSPEKGTAAANAEVAGSDYNTIPDNSGGYGESDNAWGAQDDGVGDGAAMNLPSDVYSSDAKATPSPALFTTSGVSAVEENSLSNMEELDRREQVLLQKERECREKEMLIRMREEKMMGTYTAPDNWPCKCYPVTYHSIKEDVDAAYQPHMRRMYAVCLLSMFCFAWNTVAILCAWFANCVNQSGLVFIWSGAYLFIGSWMVWATWYKGMYNKLKSTSTAKKWAIKWWWLLFWFGVHVIWCGICTVGFTDWGMAGIFVMIDCFKGYQGNDKQSNAGVAIIVLIATVFWAINFLASILMLKRSGAVYRKLGVDNQARQEAKGILAAAEFVGNNADQFVPVDGVAQKPKPPAPGLKTEH